MVEKNTIKKTEKDFQKILGEKRERLRQLRFALPGGKIKNISEIKKIKKDIARILTKVNQNKK